MGWMTRAQILAESMQGFSLCYCVQIGSAVHPAPTQQALGDLTPGVKWPGCEADDNSPPYSAKVVNVWSYTFTSSHIFMAWCL